MLPPPSTEQISEGGLSACEWTSKVMSELKDLIERMKHAHAKKRTEKDLLEAQRCDEKVDPKSRQSRDLSRDRILPRLSNVFGDRSPF
jgi:hypothetical protein